MGAWYERGIPHTRNHGWRLLVARRTGRKSQTVMERNAVDRQSEESMSDQYDKLDEQILAAITRGSHPIYAKECVIMQKNA